MRLIKCSVLTFALAGLALEASAQTSRLDQALDLTSPQAAVETYAAAFADDDYAAVFLVLAPQAQDEFLRAMHMFKFETFSRLEPMSMDDYASDAAAEYASDPDKPMLGPTIMQTFNYLMHAADAGGAHLIDFGAGGLFGETLTIESVGDTFTVDGWSRTWVETELAGEGPVSFLLQQSPEGRWRVLSIVAHAGSDHETVFLPVRD